MRLRFRSQEFFMFGFCISEGMLQIDLGWNSVILYKDQAC